MRKFHYDAVQVLRLIMLAAGGVLILALAGKYEKESDKDGGSLFWENCGQEMMAEGGAAIFRYSYPGRTKARET